MSKRHLKRINMPKTWIISRKTNMFVLRPYPGGASANLSMPLGLILSELINYAKTAREVKKILNTKEILVNGVRRKTNKFSVGIMDVVSCPLMKENYRLMLNKKDKLVTIDIEDSEAKIKPTKILGKKTINGNKTQINLSDGKNMIFDKDPGYKVGDSLIISVPENKIKDHIKLEKGNAVYLIGGGHIGFTGTVEDIKGDKIVFRTDNGEVYETSKSYAFIVGKEKPVIKI